MTEHAYAVVGREGSNHVAVALDLAGAFATGGRETVVVELAPGPSALADLLDLPPDAPGDGVEAALATPEDAPATVRVAVEDTEVDSLGVLAAATDRGGDPDPGTDPDGTGDLSVGDLPALLSSLGGEYDVAVLAVGVGSVADVSPLDGTLDGCVAAVAADGDRTPAAPRLVERLDEAGVGPDGLVVTDCTDEPELWTARSGVDAEVLAVVPPARPDRVDVLGDRIRDVRDGLADTRGLLPEGPDLDEGRPVRSPTALLAGETDRVRVVEDPDSGPTPTAGAYGAEGSLGDPATATDAVGGDGDGESWTDVPVDPGGDGPATTGEDGDGPAFEFGKLPAAEGDGNGGAAADGEGDGDSGTQSADEMADAVADILESGETGPGSPAEEPGDRDGGRTDDEA